MANPRPNPYIGPQPFTTGQRLYGRDRETLDLLDLLIAERIVLFYSPSGAGKTSLLQAALVPRLVQKLFDVLPVMRVNKELPADLAGFNRYVASALLSLDETPQLQNDSTLASYLDARMNKTSTRQVLIFDQFEEILSIDPTDEATKVEFFAQVGKALLNRKRWAIFSMREDYVAGLDRYLNPIPTQFTNTYRLDLLTRSAACEAIQGPSLASGVVFSDQAANKLTEDLAQVIVQQADGKFKSTLGLYVEPVQLQVVCLRVWENLDADDQEISELDIEEVGDVNTALAGYYADRVQSIAQDTNVSERTIREWFDSELITPRGLRSQVLMEPESSRGLSNEAIHQFEDAHLIRAEHRRGTIWFELVHDRFIEPIRANNTAWFKANLSALQRQAELWDNEGRREGYLITGQALIEVDAWTREHEGELTQTDKEFLARCHAMQTNAEREQRLNRRIRWLAIGASVLSLIALGALVLALMQQKIALSREQAALAIVQLNTDPKRSVLLALEAIDSADTSEAETSLRKSLVEDRLITILSDNVSWVSSAAFSRDGTKILIASGDTARIFDANSGEVLTELNGHTKHINTSSFSPDGQFVVTASDDNTGRIWNLNTCHPSCTYIELVGHEQGVSQAIFNPAGTRIATVSRDKSVRIWDASTGQNILVLGGTQKYSRISYSPDGRRIAAIGEDYSIYLYDSTTGQMLNSLQGHTNEITCIAFTSDGQLIASGSKDKTTRIWNTTNGILLAELKGHTDRITGVSFSSDNQYILTASADQTARVWDWRSGELISELRGHTGAVNGAVFSRDMKLVLTASADYTARLWETFSGRSLAVLRGHTYWVYGASFDPLKNRILTMSADGTARLWNADPLAGVLELRGHTLDINDCAVSPDGSYVVTASSDNTARVWEKASGHVVAILSGHIARLNKAAFSPDSRFVVTASEDNTARIWDIANCHPDCLYTELIGHQLGVKSARFSPDGNYIVTASNDQTARVWERTTGQIIHEFSHNDWVWDAGFSPDGRFIVTASASADPVATVWDLQTSNPVVKLKGHKDSLTSASFSPDGSFIVTASRDNTVRVWDWKMCQEQTNCPYKELKGSDWFLEATFSPDGKWIVAASRDRTARVWEWQTGKLISVIEGHTGAVNSSVFGPNNQFLITGSSDGTARIWPRASFAPFQEVIKIACLQVGGDGKSVVSKLCPTITGRNQP